MPSLTDDLPLVTWGAGTNGIFTPQSIAVCSPRATTIQHVRIAADSVDPGSVPDFCQRNGISQKQLYQVAWGLTLGCYNGAVDIAAGYQFLSNHVNNCCSSVFHCNFDGSQLVLDVFRSLREDLIQTAKVDLDCGRSLERVAATSGLINTALSVCDNDYDPAKRASTFHHDGPLNLESSFIMHAVVMKASQSKVLFYKAPTLHQDQALAILETFENAVQQITMSGKQDLLRDLSLVGSFDLNTIISWNKQDFETHEKCIFHYFEEYADLNPDKEAVISDGDGNFTFRELDETTSRVARYMIDNGVTRGAIVPFFFEKSPWTIISMIATMKAGAAYVGLNPEMPPDRLQFIFERTKAPFILVSRLFQGTLQEMGIPCIVLDAKTTSELSAYPPNFHSPARPEDIAYIVFTSGSTGQPKGIMTEHRAWVACALNQQKAALVDETTRMLQFSAHNFDAVNFEVLTILMAGGTVCVPTEHSRLNDLAGTVRKLNVNYLGTTPALAKIISPEDVPELRTFGVWGEAASQDIIDRWSSALDMVNVYGPGEASCIFSVNIYSRQSRRAKNIGRSLRNAAGWVVSPENPQRLVPIGAIGELVIQGSILGRGYLHEPDLTAAAYKDSMKWIPETTSPALKRVYLTGDLVRQNRDGSFEYCGRKDKQVKIRGQRVELGEIEHAINIASPRGSSSAVEVCQPSWRRDKDMKILVAFQGPGAAKRDGSARSLLLPFLDETLAEFSRLKYQLLRSLPGYMVPTAFLPLSYLPTTQQGKIDSKYLISLVEDLSETELAEYSLVKSNNEPPESPLELIFQQIFAETLSVPVDQIGKHSSFFWLGGDSIKAMTLTALARERGFTLTIPDVLQHPDLSQLALFAEQLPINSEIPSYKAFDGLSDVSDASAFVRTVLSPCLGVPHDAIEDALLATDYQASSTAWSMLKRRGGINFLIFDFSKPIATAKVKSACVRLVKRHPVLRTVFMTHDRKLLQVVMKPSWASITRHKCPRSLEETTQTIVDEDAYRQVDPTKQKIQFKLLGKDKGVDRLLIRISHAQYDGQSFFQLGKELKAAYLEQTSVGAPTFPQYLHVARTRYEMKSLHFWRELLKGSLMTPIVAHKRPMFINIADGIVKRRIPTEITKPHPNVSGASAVKTAWSLVLAQMTGRRDIVFGSPVWGRNAPVPGADLMIGSSINHIPVRARLDSSKTYLDLLESIQEQHVASMHFEGMGANTIVEKCTDWPRWQRLSSLVLYQGLPNDSANDRSALTIEDGVTFQMDEIVSPADRTDLLLHVEPHGEETVALMRFSKRNIPEAIATEVMNRFITILKLVSQDVNAPQSLDTSESPILPLPVASPEFKQTMEEGNDSVLTNGNHSENIQTSSFEISSAVKDTVTEAWANCLSLTPLEIQDCLAKKTAYYEIWGNLIAAHALVRFYEEKGFEVAMEDVIENATIAEQEQLLSRLVN